MKIVVYNFKDQFALSRSQVEKIREVLPKEYFAPIKEFHLLPAREGETFEFRMDQKVAYFAFPVKNKTSDIVAEAVTELLLGLARIKGKSKFGVPLSPKERERYLPFVEEWKGRCLLALEVPNEP